MKIDHDALEAICRHSHVWRAVHAPALSGTYVPGEGQESPIAFIVGEAPGAQEDIKKRPFVGSSGRVLRQLMSTAGLFTGYAPDFGEPNAWLTNVVKFRPPRNRKPLPVEIKWSRPFLRQEWIAVGKPPVIIPVGGTALTAIMGKPRSILKVSGKLWKVHSKRSNVDLFVWPMVHPSFGLRNKAVQPILEQDWERLGTWLDKEEMRHVRQD